MDALHLGLPALVFIIVVALAFDFINGLHDAANSIATVVSTRVLSPKLAVAWAAFSTSSPSCFLACTSPPPSAPGWSNRRSSTRR